MRKRNVKNAIVKTIAFVSATAMLSTSFSTISFAKEVPEDTETSDSAYSKVVESDLTEDIALDEIEEVAAAEVDDAEIESSIETDAETAEEVDAEDAEAEEVEAEDGEAEDAETEDAETDEVDAEEAEAEDAEDAEADDVEAEEAEAEDAEDAETEEVDVVEEAEEVDAEDAEDAEAEEVDAEEVDAEDAEEIDTEEEVSIANELATVKNGWEKQSDGTYKYYENGTAVTKKVKKIGNDYFGFDSNGIMYDNKVFSLYDGSNSVNYRAKEGGYLYVNSWYETEYGYKYYYGAGGRANVGTEVLTIDGVKYLFSNGGQLITGGRGEVNGVIYVSDRDGKAYAAKLGGWTLAGVDWYYFNERAVMATGWVYTNKPIRSNDHKNNKEWYN